MPSLSLSPATVSAPGKLILAGEHAVVYGRPAIVGAVDLRLQASIRPLHGNEVRLELGEAAGGSISTTWSEILERTAAAQQAWQRWSQTPGQPFPTFDAHEAGVVQIALGEAANALDALDAPKDSRPPSLELRVDSALPVGSGLGSSAAAAVAVVGAYVAARGRLRSIAEARDLLHRVSLDVERRQHGLPSGVDNATVLSGGVLWAQRSAGPGSALDYRTLSPSSPSLGRLRLIHGGRPGETTGAVVTAVRDAAESDPSRFEQLFDRLGETASEIATLVESQEPEENAWKQTFAKAQRALEALGVVPKAAQKFVREIEARGGAAKISGAGALTGGAGMIVVYHPETEALDEFLLASGLPAIAAQVGAAGARVEASVL